MNAGWPLDFKPDYTPEQMLRLGVFGGNYFHDAQDADFDGLGQAKRLAFENNMEPFRKERNYYGVKAGQTYAEWMANGWIFPEDPLGWFHWYCRYHNGRRHMRDRHQIRRWVKYKSRWGRFARTQALHNGDASLVVKQGLLQWGINPVELIHGDQHAKV